MAALINRTAELELAALQLIAQEKPAEYVRGWVAAWLTPAGLEPRLERGEAPTGEEYRRGLEAGELAMERNAIRGGRL